MKTKLFLCFAIVVMAIAHTSCKKATYLKADKQTINFSRAGGSQSVVLSSDVEGFKLESAPEWAEATVEGNNLNVTVKENDAKALRTSTIVVSVSGMQLEIPIRQTYKATYLRVNPSSVTFSKNGGEETLQVECDGDVNVGAAEDLTVTLEGNILKIQAPANSGSEKKATVSLFADAQKAVVAIIREGSVCSTCGGSGKIWCRECGGDGWYGDMPCYNCGGWDDGWEYHGGSGKVTCPTCHGTGH